MKSGRKGFFSKRGRGEKRGLTGRRKRGAHVLTFSVLSSGGEEGLSEIGKGNPARREKNRGVTENSKIPEFLRRCLAFRKETDVCIIKRGGVSGNIILVGK